MGGGEQAVIEFDATDMKLCDSEDKMKENCTIEVLSTEDENSSSSSIIKKADDGTVWETMKEGKDVGRLLDHTIFKNVTGLSFNFFEI